MTEGKTVGDFRKRIIDEATLEALVKIQQDVGKLTKDYPEDAHLIQAAFELLDLVYIRNAEKLGWSDD